MPIIVLKASRKVRTPSRAIQRCNRKLEDLAEERIALVGRARSSFSRYARPDAKRTWFVLVRMDQLQERKRKMQQRQWRWQHKMPYQVFVAWKRVIPQIEVQTEVVQRCFFLHARYRIDTHTYTLMHHLMVRLNYLRAHQRSAHYMKEEGC